MTETLERVLLVEDDPALQVVARTALENVGRFKVEVCSCGEDALHVAPRFAPQLVLLDVMMPRMDGLETMRHLRMLPAVSAAPVVFMTAKAQSHEVAHYMSLGAVDVVSKPFDPISLPQRLREAWSRSQKSQVRLDGVDGSVDESAEQCFAEQLQTARADFSADLANRLQQLLSAFSNCISNLGSPESVREFYRLAHSLTGASATLGFSSVSGAARALEARLKRMLPRGPDHGVPFARGDIEPLLEKVKSVIDSQGDVQAVPQPAPKLGMSARPGASKVLVVEDDEVIARHLVEQLSHFGYSARSVGTVADLRSELEHGVPAILLMDYELPDGDGATEVLNLRSSGFDRPVVFLTAHDGLQERLEGVRAGASAYFVKPVNVGELVSTIDRLTDSSRSDPLRALIVDDSVSQGTLYRSFLEQRGMRVEAISNPLDVMIKLGEFRPDVILLDLHMEPCNGFEIAAVLRQHHVYFDIPIIFLTAEANQESMQRAAGMGADAFLDKSVHPQVLIDAAVSHAQRARAIRSMVVRDGLTGLLNHSAIKESLEREIAAATRRGWPLCVAMLDLDHFKRVNDNYGHQAGDRILKSLSQLLTTRLRRSDAIGRYGGEEVMIVLQNTTLAEANRILEDARARFSALDHANIERVTFSAGVAALGSGMDATELARCADAALYIAKKDGRNRVVCSEA